MSSNETAQEHFGKRGISWHGCLLTFFVYVEDGQTELPESEGGVECLPGRAERRTVYLDQILSGGNKQDGLAVASMVEAALHHLGGSFPDLSKVTVQSDNAKCYQSHELVLLLGLMNPTLPIKIEGIIHTETQDGKG